MKRNLEFLTEKEGISRRDALRIGFTTLGSLLVPSYLSSCKPSGGRDDPAPSPTPTPTPTNNNPVINTNSLPNADESTPYSTQINASDPDNDSLIYNLKQKPNGMANTGSSISWTNPTVGDHPITIEVLDGRGGSASKNLVLKVNNLYDDVSGTLKDILSGNPVQGADVVLGHRDSNGNFIEDYRTRSDSQGNYLHQRIPTNNNFLVKIEHPNYFTHLAGNIQTTKDENGVNLELIPTTFDMDFFNEVARNPGHGGQTQKWLQVPQVYINISPALGSGIQPIQSEIDLVESILRNDIPLFNFGFTDSSIRITKGTNPPAYGTPGIIRFEWDDNSGGLGFNGEYMNGNEIIAAVCGVKTRLSGNLQLYTNRQELGQVWGPRSDDDTPPIRQSIFADPQPTGVDNYTQLDLDLGRILYKRPVGNKSTVDAVDSNPDNYRLR